MSEAPAPQKRTKNVGVASRLRNLIAEHYQEHGFIPLPREMAETIGVSAQSVHSAIKVLIQSRYLDRVSMANYEPGPEMLRSMKRRAISRALEDRQMLKNLVGDIDIY